MSNRTAPGVDILEIDESQFIVGASTSIGGMMGIAERGPVNVPTLITSWPQFKATFGNLISGSYAPYAAQEALDRGAIFYFNRITALDVNFATKAVVATVNLLTAGGGATAGLVAGSVAGTVWQNLRTWSMLNGDVLAFKVDGGAKETGTISAVAATKTTGAQNFVVSNGDTILYKSGPSYAPGPVRTITFAGVTNGAATAAQIASNLGDQMVGCHAVVSGATVVITSDIKGTASRIEFTGGTALAALTLLVEVLVGSGNVADVDHVTVAELNTLLSGVDAGVSVTLSGTNGANLNRTVSGSTKSIQVVTSNGNETSGAANLGWDTTLHSGTSNTATATLRADAESPGTWGNSLTVDIANATLNPTTRFKVTIKRNGVVVGTPQDELSMDPTDARYVQTVYLTDPYVRLTDLFAGLADFPTDRPAVQSATALISGGDGLSGIGDSDYQGDSATKTGLYAFDPINDCSFLGIPGMTSRSVLGSLFAYCESRQTIFGVADVPQGLTPQQVKDFRMATGAYAGGSAFSTTYGDLYHNWLKITDDLTKGKKYVPPMGFIFGVYTFTDRTETVWRAPAGPKRGRITGVDAVYSALSDSDVGFIYSAGVNCIVNDPQFGITVMGQKTLAGTPSKLDRVNIRRGLIYLRVSLMPTVRFVTLFEPNDPITWRALGRVIDPFMKQQVAARGISDYKFVCDASTNSAGDIAAHKLTAKLFVKPIDAAEFIEVDVVIVANDVDLKLAA